MLCLMYECGDRGVLSTGGVAWTIEEIAAVISGDTSEILKCIEELLLKGVAHQNTDKAVFSKRMVRDQQKRAQGKERVAKYRSNTFSNGSCNASVTPNEDEHEVPAVEVVPEKTKVVAATFSLRGPSHAELICAEYPLKVEMAEAVMECDLALTRLINGEMGGAKMSAGDAKFFLDGRVKAYRKSPEGKSKYAPNPAKWFKKSRYLDDEEAWYARGKEQTRGEEKQQQGVDAIRGALDRRAARRVSSQPAGGDAQPLSKPPHDDGGL